MHHHDLVVSLSLAARARRRVGDHRHPLDPPSRAQGSAITARHVEGNCPKPRRCRNQRQTATPRSAQAATPLRSQQAGSTRASPNGVRGGTDFLARRSRPPPAVWRQ